MSARRPSRTFRGIMTAVRTAAVAILIVCPGRLPAPANIGNTEAAAAIPERPSPSTPLEKQDTAPRKSAPRADGRLHVGVLREDGVMLPFASFDGDDWKSAWPQDITNRVLPASVDDIDESWWGGRAPGAWRLWSPDQKGPSPPLSLKSPATIAVGQVRRLGIRTDYRPAPVPVPPFAMPFPKAGLAIAGETTIDPIASVSRLIPAWGQMLGSVRKAVDTAEERALVPLQRYASWVHPYDKAFRAKVAPELEAWYTTRFTDQRYGVSYIEAVKKYPPGPKDEGCGLETFITGWVHHAPEDAPPKTDFRAVIVYCDRDKASYMLPFGQLEARGRTHWILQMSGQTHEWYAVVELRPGRVRYVAQYEAGLVLR
jgi:hypothetical protein